MSVTVTTDAVVRISEQFNDLLSDMAAEDRRSKKATLEILIKREAQRRKEKEEKK